MCLDAAMHSAQQKGYVCAAVHVSAAVHGTGMALLSFSSEHIGPVGAQTYGERHFRCIMIIAHGQQFRV